MSADTRQAAVDFYRALLDMALDEGDREGFERLLFDLFDRGVEVGAQAAADERYRDMERKLARQRELFEEASALAAARGRQLAAAEAAIARGGAQEGASDG